LFPATRSHCPYPATPTAFVEEVQRGENGPPARISIAADGAVCVITDAKDGSTTRAVFVPIGFGRWIAQMQEKDSVSYMIATRSRDRLTYYAPQCEDFGDSRLRQAKVETEDANGRTMCLATDAQGLERLLRLEHVRQAAGRAVSR